MSAGKHCKVEGCGRTARVEVWLGADAGSDVLLTRSIETEELRACMEHAEKLGTVRGLDSDYEEPYVILRAENVPGWALRLIVRAAGRWDVALYEPAVEVTS